MSKIYTVVLLILAVALLTSACAPSMPAPTAAPATSVTVGQLAEQGKTVLATKGSCHGENGQGFKAPAIIGSNAQMAKYNNAKQLLDYISSTMPANAPGSLTQQEYVQVLCFILRQNKFVSADTAIDPNQLERITLKK